MKVERRADIIIKPRNIDTAIIITEIKKSEDMTFLDGFIQNSE